MRANSLEILAITALLVNYVTGDAKAQTTTEISIEDSTAVSKAQSSSDTSAKPTFSSENVTKKAPMDYWMRKMGSMEYNLLNVQAIIVKDEDLNDSCKPAPRKSDKRYLMCAGSILNRDHVLTSASCVHEATHIRHNVHAPLAVVIAPLKMTMQVIPAVQYFIHPDHQTNPYSHRHTKHNVAIIKLSCRIDMENYHKIELPSHPMRQTCSEDNCIVAVFRRTGKTTHVMFQMLAPDMPYSFRRRKETSVQDVELHVSKEYGRSKMIDGSIHLERPKRKLAVPPSFMGRYESKKIFDEDPMTSTTETPTENLIVVKTTIFPMAVENISSTTETSLQEEVSKALSEPGAALQPVKSFVVRSSEWYIPCAPTGAPVLQNRTQAALVAIPCNGRQPRSKWYYTDLYDNLDWIRRVINEISRGPMPNGPRLPSHAGNGSGCSTCIFNFFIEINCKDKGNCGKSLKTLPGPNRLYNHSGQTHFQSSRPISPNLSHPVSLYSSHPVAANPSRPVPPNSPSKVFSNPAGEVPPNSPSKVFSNPAGEVSSNSPGEVSSNPPDEVPSNRVGEVLPADGVTLVLGRKKMQGSCTRNSVGVEVGPGCDKTEKESKIRPMYRTKSVKPINGVGKMKQGLQQNSAVAGRIFKDSYGDYLVGKAKYLGDDNTRISAISQNPIKPGSRNFHRERATNEIGLQNIEGESSDWLSEVEKRLELDSEVKRELVKSRRSSSN